MFSWEEDEGLLRDLERGSKIETVILAIDADRERISLGIKQLQNNFFNDFVSVNKEGDKIKAKVKSFSDEKIILNLVDKVDGVLSQKDFNSSSLEVSLEEGLDMEVVLAKIIKKERKIILSLRALEKAEEKEAIQENMEKNKEIEESSNSSIGDMIKSEIEDKENE